MALTFALEKNVLSFVCSTITLRQTYEKRLSKQREDSLKIGQSLDTYKVEVLTLRWEQVQSCDWRSQENILFSREAYEKKLRVKDELINELNERLTKNETEQATRQHTLQLKVMNSRAGVCHVPSLDVQIEHFQRSFETLQSRNKQLEQNNQITVKENHDLLKQISNLQVSITCQTIETTMLASRFKFNAYSTP